MKPTALLVPVSDILLALKWYKKAFPMAVEVYDEEADFTYLSCSGVSIELVYADKKVPSGRAGTVLYWSVEHLQTEIDRFKTLGAFVYRGPMKISDGLGMCQVTDPFGNLIGLRGPYSKL